MYNQKIENNLIDEVAAVIAIAIFLVDLKSSTTDPHESSFIIFRNLSGNFLIALVDGIPCIFIRPGKRTTGKNSRRP